MHYSAVKRTLACFFMCFFAFLYLPCIQAGEKRWVTTNEWSGRGTRQTEVFLVRATKWRIKYMPRGERPFYISVYGVDGKKQGEAAVQPLLMDAARTLRTEKGEKYLRVEAPHAEWRVSVQQYLSIIEEWKVQSFKSRSSTMDVQSVATWTGEDVSRSYEVVFAREPWYITCRNQGQGQLQVEVKPIAGEKSDPPGGAGGEEKKRRRQTRATPSGFGPLMDLTIGSGQEQTGWGYRTGRYNISVEAADTQWKIDAAEEMQGQKDASGRRLRKDLPVEPQLVPRLAPEKNE